MDAALLERIQHDLARLDLTDDLDRTLFRVEIQRALDAARTPEACVVVVEGAIEQLHQIDLWQLADDARHEIETLISHLCMLDMGKPASAALPHQTLMWTGGESQNMSMPSV